MHGSKKSELGNSSEGRFPESSDVVKNDSQVFFGVKYWSDRTTNLSSHGKDCNMNRVWGELS